MYIICSFSVVTGDCLIELTALAGLTVTLNRKTQMTYYTGRHISYQISLYLMKHNSKYKFSNYKGRFTIIYQFVIMMVGTRNCLLLKCDLTRLINQITQCLMLQCELMAFFLNTNFI
jgi:hypothetical protein